MKYTLLQMTQDILSAMDGDEVNSINDNVEAMQVATIIKTVYNDIVSRAEMTSQMTMFALSNSSDVTKPVLMTKPNNIVDIDFIKYDKHLLNDTDAFYDFVSYLAPVDFLTLTLGYTMSTGDVLNYTLSFNGQSIQMFCKNDIAPTWYTSFDDTTIVFDSYDSSVDTVLQASKCICYGEQSAAFQMLDTFIPPLEDHHFMILLNDSKALAYAEMKQAEHVIAEKNGRRGWVHLQKTRRTIPDRTPEINRLPNYGRGGYGTDDDMIRLMRKGN